MSNDTLLLTKSDFIAALQCHKRLHLERFAPSLRDPITEGDKLRIQDGLLVGELARKRYRDGVLIEQRSTEQAIAATREVLDKGSNVLYEACVAHGGLFARIDILKATAEVSFQPSLMDDFYKCWEIIEVKSSSSPKPGKSLRNDNLWDIAFQTYVARQSGMRIEKAKLLLLSGEYVHFGGEHDLQSLFVEINVTQQVEALLPKVVQRIKAMREVLAESVPPDIEVGQQCKFPYKCPFYGHCHGSLDDDHLIRLPKVTASQLAQFRRDGIGSIREIPPNAQLSDEQRRAVQAHTTGNVVVEGLAERLESLRYPIHFLDFETVAFAVPFYPNTKPHDVIPVQWSNHVLEENGRLEHREFLHTSPDDPRPSFCTSLSEVLQGARSIVVYSKFEWRVLKSLAKWDENIGAELFQTFADRVFDLLDALRSHVYRKEFEGSFSLKKVLPTLVPDLCYDDLNICDGASATAQYRRLIDPDTPESERARIKSDLLEYCKRDTLAMVRLYEALKNLIMEQR